MERLPTRLQYKNYEPGEFTDAGNQTLGEVTRLIRDYPWSEERHLTPVGPTCPSVTVEDVEGNYLKLGHSYYEKYCLYYLPANGTLSKKVVATLDEALEEVARFYNGTFTEDGYEHVLALHAQRHFISKDFTCSFSYKGQLFSTCAFSFGALLIVGMAIFVCTAGTAAMGIRQAIWVDLIVGALGITMGVNAVIQWRLYLNHYRYSKGKVLILSRGKKEFVFGAEDDPITYHKADISSIREYINTRSRNPSSGLYYTLITFKDGREITLPSMLVQYAYRNFPDQRPEIIPTFMPMIRA